MGDCMKCDVGFWDINGNYIPNIQEIDEKELRQIDADWVEFVEEFNRRLNNG